MREMTWKKLFYLVIMSSTRAALRRNEVKSSTPAPSIPPRGGSIPSIQGSNSFNQQVAMRQHQHQQTNQPRQQQMNQPQPQRPSQPNGQKPVQKQQLTIEQAITLITLRLGRLELGFQQFDSHESNGSMNEDLAQNILTRLETLEDIENDNTNNNNNRQEPDTTEITMLKQQMETMKQFITKSFKTVNTTISSFKNEITDLRKSLQSLEKISIENNAQLMVLSMNAMDGDADDDETEELAAVSEADEETDVAVSVADEETDGVINDIDETQPGVLVEDEPDDENA